MRPGDARGGQDVPTLDQPAAGALAFLFCSQSNSSFKPTCVLPNLTVISLAAVTCPFLYYSQINLSFRPKRQMATISK